MMSHETDRPGEEMSHPPRGFVYFCEATLRYNRGLRAWLFFAPYLAGAVWLESSLDLRPPGTLWSWGVLLAYLVIFPPVWRSVLLRTGLWRKRASESSASGSSHVGHSA